VYNSTIFLTRKSLRPSVVLPFHLVWFGRLSKKQGTIALEKGLIVALRSSSKSERSGRTVQMTKRGRRGIEDILGSEESNIPRVFAHLLSKSGHVTEDPFYIYANAPLLESWRHKKNQE
jgi:hypothetical protein